jgi:hypothetical protein
MQLYLRADFPCRLFPKFKFGFEGITVSDSQSRGNGCRVAVLLVTVTGS